MSTGREDRDSEEDQEEEDDEDYDFLAVLSSIDSAPLLVNGHNSSGFFPQFPVTNSNANMVSSVHPSYWPSGTTSPPPLPQQQQQQRMSRSNSGNFISARLRCASEMHQSGVLGGEEKKFMKNCIMSNNARFNEEFALAERTNNWDALARYVRENTKAAGAADAMASQVMDSLQSEFDLLNEKSRNSTTKKRMASNSFGRPKKVPISAQQPSAAVAVELEAKKYTEEDLDFDGSGLNNSADEQAAKQKKNERERKRRFAVGKGFDILFDLLNLPPAAKIDKATILQRSADRIVESAERISYLEMRVAQLEYELSRTKTHAL